ncbi:MAG: hypothetical protein HOM25_20240 [Rhodospirillaceae bacterium]|nr:hypothetical protein [Rhodospirillaceae bacterium]
MTVKYIFRTLGAAVCILMFSTSVQADHRWGAYHWARSAAVEINLKVVNSTTGDWTPVLSDSIAEWNVSEIFELGIDRDDTSKRTRKRCNSVTGQMRVCNAAYGYNGWLGMATINIDAESHIVKGTAKVNDSYSSYWAIEGEMNHVLCQEMGHVFGLGHTSEDGSSQLTCMDYSSDPGSQWPNEHDYDLLTVIYDQVDAYNSYDDSVGGGGGGDTKPCRGKKCPNFGEPEIPPMGVRVHRGRNHEVWVARGRADSLWIHHVRLVPEEYR